MGCQSLRGELASAPTRARSSTERLQSQTEQRADGVKAVSRRRRGRVAPALSPADHWSTSAQLLPGDRAFLSPSSAETSSANLTPASRRQDHTTSPSALAPFVSAAFASTASRPAFVTIASRPSVGRDGAVVKVIWVNREQIYFCEKGWTGEQPICPSGKERTGAIFAKSPVMTTCVGHEASGHQHSCSEG